MRRAESVSARDWHAGRGVGQDAVPLQQHVATSTVVAGQPGVRGHTAARVSNVAGLSAAQAVGARANDTRDRQWNLRLWLGVDRASRRVLPSRASGSTSRPKTRRKLTCWHCGDQGSSNSELSSRSHLRPVRQSSFCAAPLHEHVVPHSGAIVGEPPTCGRGRARRYCLIGGDTAFGRNADARACLVGVPA